MRSWGVALLLLAAALSDSSFASDAPVRGGQIRVAIPSDLRGTNPGVDRDAITDDVLAHVVEGLVAFRNGLSVGLMLARGVQVSEDGRTYTFQLRDDVRFHNGAPLTSAEVKWSWQRYLDPATHWRCTSSYNGVEASKIIGIETPDRHTVVFSLDKPDGLFLKRMASFVCPAAILHPDSVGPNGIWRAPVGTGPYRFAEWKRGQYALLTRFDGYVPRSEPRDGYAGAKIPYADSLKWLIVPDSSAAMSALRSMQVDLAYFFPPSELESARHESGVAVHTTPALDWTTLLMQSTDPLLRDIRVRKAIAHAIDTRALSQMASYGLSVGNPSVVPAASQYYTPVHAEGYSYDPELSKRLLREAGYDGRPIRLQTNRRNERVYDSVIVVETMLRKVGINVRIEVLDWAVMFSNWQHGRFQLMVFNYSARPDPVLGYLAVLGTKRTQPTTQWESSRAASLLAEATATADENARTALFEQIHRLMLQDVPFVNLFNGSAIDVTLGRVAGYEVWSASKPRLWGVWVRR